MSPCISNTTQPFYTVGLLCQTPILMTACQPGGSLYRLNNDQDANPRPIAQDTDTLTPSHPDAVTTDKAYYFFKIVTSRSVKTYT